MQQWAERAMESFNFTINVAVSQGLLQYLTLSNRLQSPSCNLVNTSQQTSKLFHCLLLNSLAWGWNHVIWLGNWRWPLSMPVGSQAIPLNISAATPKEYWRVNPFLLFVNHLQTKLNNCMCDLCQGWKHCTSCLANRLCWLINCGMVSNRNRNQWWPIWAWQVMSWNSGAATAQWCSRELNLVCASS